MVQYRLVVEPAEELTRPSIEVAPQAQERDHLAPFAGEDAADPGGDRLGKRAQDQVEAFERRKAEDAEEIVAVVVAAVRALRRGTYSASLIFMLPHFASRACTVAEIANSRSTRLVSR